MRERERDTGRRVDSGRGTAERRDGDWLFFLPFDLSELNYIIDVH